MGSIIRVFALICIVYSTLIQVTALAQSGGDEYQEVEELDQAAITSRLNGIQVLDPNSPLGESVNLDMGSLSFSQTDVSIPGNSDLPVSFGRTYALESNDISDNVFGGWAPDVPYLTATVTTHDAFTSPSEPVGWLGSDCMVPATRHAPGSGGSVDAFRSINSFWQGLTMHIPGQGDKLVLTSGQALENFDGINFNVGTDQDTGPIFSNGPTNGFALRTSDHWTLGCLPNGNFGAIAHAPNGWKYYFDYVTETRAGDRQLLRTLFGVDPATGQPYACSVQGPRSDCLASAGRNVVNFNVWATRVEDPHGNYVDYNYSDGLLRSIISNDGRRIDLTYESVTYNAIQDLDRNGRRLKTVRTNGRTWTYNYHVLGIYSHLDEIVLPDGRTWEFDLPPMRVKAESHECYRVNRGGAAPENYTVKGPTGLLATYGTRLTHQGKTGIPRRIVTPQDRSTIAARVETCDDYEIPTYSVARSLVSKTYNVPQGGTYTWQYNYQEDEGGFATDSISDLKRREIVDPDGNRSVAFYNRRFQSDYEGLVVRREEYDGSSGALLETTHLEYGKGPNMGNSTILFAYAPPRTHERPLVQSRTIRDGVTYTTDHTYQYNTGASTYSYGAPTRSVYSSTLQSSSRITDYVYEHNKPAWILTLPSTITRNGKQFHSFTYDAEGNVTRHNRFGALSSTRDYHSDGNVAWSRDALGRQVSFDNYKRGIAQELTFPLNTRVSRTLDNNGWITSTTTANRHTTTYQYDSMGRTTQIDPPGTRATTTISYSNLGSGLVETATTGNQRVTTNYDGLYRPYLVATQAISGGGGTIYNRTQYDGLNRPIFQSFPSFSSNATTGVETSYDGLGRVIRERENVSPYATTNTSYLSGNRIRVADPEGNLTTTTYSGYGGPADGNPIRTDQPEGVSTSMSYDIFGNLLNATQSGITQTWAYDNRLRLQSHYTPEQGCWIYGYNNADERTSIAHGPNQTCAPSNGSTTTNTYDSLGRLTNINYPSGTADVAMTYDANGNILTNVRGPASWTYTWDENDQLLTETLRIDGKTFAMGHTYNSNGARSRWTAPNGGVWDFYPDGHGRRTGVVSAAFNWNLLSGATYHPNGELKRISYWNGLFYESTQNARQQIDYIHHAFVLRQNINYDNNGRITRIDDWNDNSRDRDYTYDGLGRLKTANGPWGNGSYTYNNRNNITRKQLGSRVVDIQYDNTNRVQQHRDSFNGNAWQNHIYDTRGNATDNGPINFAYDWANQPTSMSGSDSGAFTYDGNYKRVKQVINGNTAYSVYDLDGVLVWRETNGWPVSELSVGGQSTRIGGVAPNIHKDLLGSPIAATSFDGIAWREDYTPFGESRLNPAGNADSHNFTGHIRDNDTGLVYMQARYYDPVIGRFLSADPVGFAEGGTGYFNRYAYTANDPVNNIDPDGRFVLGLVSKGFKVLRKGGDVGATFAGAAQDVGTIFSGSASLGDRALAAVSLASEIASPVSVRDGKAAVRAVSGGGDAAKLGDDALVVRGGTNTADRFTNGSGVTTRADGTLDGVSVNSAPGASVAELSADIPNKQIGVTTVGDIRAAGGDVVPSPTASRPNHCTMCGVSAEKAEELFTPTQRNPNQ